VSFGSGPCLVSCGPLLLSFIVGSEKPSGKALSAYLFFSLGRIAVYAALGLCVFFIGRVVVFNQVWLATKYLVVFGGIFVFLIGILMLIGIGPSDNLCGRLQKNLLTHDKISPVAMGAIIGLLPCGPLVALFSYIGLTSKTWLQSLTFSLAFGLGTAISPLLLLALFAGFIPKFIAKNKFRYALLLRIVSGEIICILGIQLIWGSLSNA
jgi:sulfite exporter TauE/SafE